jgi:hemerythrin-like domain-containing protein
MNIIDILHGEHRVLLKLFDWAEDLINAKSDMGIVMETSRMVSRLLMGHANQEECTLFDALEPRLGNVGPMAVSIHRQMHKDIEKQFRAAMANNKLSIPDVQEGIRMARIHFAGEENNLFPLAKRLLDHGELEKLGNHLLETSGKKAGGNV